MAKPGGQAFEISASSLLFVSIMVMALPPISFADTGANGLANLGCDICSVTEFRSFGSSDGPLLEMSYGINGLFCEHPNKDVMQHSVYKGKTYYWLGRFLSESCSSGLGTKWKFTEDDTANYYAIPLMFNYDNTSGGLRVGNCFFILWGYGGTEPVDPSICNGDCLYALGGVRGRFVEMSPSLGGVFVGNTVEIVSGPVKSFQQVYPDMNIDDFKDQFKDNNTIRTYRIDRLAFSYVMRGGSAGVVNVSVPEQCVLSFGEGLQGCDVNGCPTGFDCIEGQCYEKVACIGTEGCPTGFKCYNNECVKETSDVTHISTPECLTTANCSAGETCSAGKCVNVTQPSGLVSNGIVQLISGDAVITHMDGTIASSTERIRYGDTVKAGENGAIFTLEDGSRMILAPGAEIVFNGTGVIDLLAGGIEYAKAAAGQKPTIRMERGTALIRSGEFIIDARTKQTTIFSHGGMMEFTPIKDGIRLPNETKTIEPSQMLFININNTATIMPLSEEDWSEQNSFFEYVAAEAGNAETKTGSEDQTPKTASPFCLGGFLIAGTGAWAYLSGRKQKKR